MRRPALGLACLAVAAALGAVPGPARKRTPRSAAAPLDFSGMWEIDPSLSVNVSSAMKDAVLSVTQKGNRIWITPVSAKAGSRIMAEEIVADGRAYEKALGPAGTGTVTADWAKDRQSLWIEVHAGDPEDPKGSAVQRIVWKLSADRKVWVRESVSVSKGAARTARLVFRRRLNRETPLSATPSRSQPTPARP